MNEASDSLEDAKMRIQRQKHHAMSVPNHKEAANMSRGIKSSTKSSQSRKRREYEWLPEIVDLVDERIYSQRLAKLLENPDYGNVLQYLERQIREARETYLYPYQPHNEIKLDKGYWQQEVEKEDVETKTRTVEGIAEIGNVEESLNTDERPRTTLGVIWSNLLSDAGKVALRLADEFEKERVTRPKTRDQRGELRARRRLLAERTIRSLQFMANIWLYEKRAETNQSFSIDERSDHTAEPVSVFRQRIRLLERQATKWRLHSALPRGEFEASFAVQYDVWSHDFSRIRDGELGWVRFARAARDQLRLQRYRMELCQQWREVTAWPEPNRELVHRVPRLLDVLWRRACAIVLIIPLRFLWAVAVTAFMLMTGYGVGLAILEVTSAITLGVFSLAYYLDNLLTRPPNTPADTLCQSIYYAVVYLTSVGADTPPAGAWTHLLIATESLTGYFLLAVVAAMFIRWLLDR